MQLYIHLILLATLILLGGHLIWNWPNPVKKLRYRHPEQALGVGPVWTEEQGPPLNYMWVWKDGNRIRMEFRNMPGVVVACDSRVAGELSEALKKMADTDCEIKIEKGIST